MQVADVENDCILLQTDIAFNLGLEVLHQLARDNQVYTCAHQTVSIDNIESDDKHYHHRFRFGGTHATSPEKVAHYFARTASSVLRMCMLRSINANDKFFPKFGAYSEPRNKSKMVYQSNGPHFVLARSKMATMEYYSYYDHLHPHFKLEHEFASALLSDQKRWFKPSTMMLIFRRNLSEVVEITTSLQAELMHHNGIYAVRSFAHVLCIVRRISNLDHHSLKLLQALKNDPSEIIARYQLALGLPALDQINNPWTLTESESESEEDSEEEYDSELDDKDDAYIAEMDPNFGMQPIQYVPPNIFGYYETVHAQPAPVLQQLIDHFAATVNIGDQPPRH